MRNDKKRRANIEAMLATNYGGRISLAGLLKPRKEISTWYCHDCCEWFRQRTDILYLSFKTRCKCNAEHPLPANPINPKQRGHCCLAFWETDGMVPPERPHIQS